MEVHKVLLVDDDADIRTIATLSLGAVGGWEVVLASGGREALDLVTKDRPDVILLDVTMPDMDGPATLAELRAGNAVDIPVIFMTARAQRREVERYLEMGAVGVITKPFDPMLLPAEVLRIVSA